LKKRNGEGGVKPQDLEMDALEVWPDFIQGWGRVCGRLFQFRVKHGRWEFAVFENPSLDPWDVDRPSDRYPGMYITQEWTKGELTEPAAIIRRCAEAYLYAIGRRQSDLRAVD
jgi:hypothetical protein